MSSGFIPVLLLLTGPALASLNGVSSGEQTRVHCVDTPVVVLETPAPGVSAQETCYYSFNLCLNDTFYQSELEEELYKLYDSLPGAAFVNIDSVSIWWQEDTLFFPNGNFKADSFQYERVWMSGITTLKGSFPDTTLEFQDKWLFLPQSPEMTYAALIDTPLVVFYDSITTLKGLGIRPLDGCYFEPTAFIITQSGIQKTGIERIPGLSVSTREFLDSIGREDLDEPPIKKRRMEFSLNWKKSNLNLRADIPVQNLKIINLRGQILQNVHLNGSLTLNLPLRGLPAGVYLARITGDGWIWQDKIYIHNFSQRREFTVELN